MRRFLPGLLAICLLFSLTGCGKPASPAESDPAPAPEPLTEAAPAPAPPPTQEELEAQQLDQILNQMTLEELVGQLFFPRRPAQNSAQDAADYHLGGYVLFRRDTDNHSPDSLRNALQQDQEAADIPLLLGVDEEGGTVVRVSANPQLRSHRFASPQTLFRSGGLEAIVSDAAEKDALLLSLGINVNLAPVADLSSNPGDFIYPRTFGQGPQETADYIAAVTGQMRADGMGSVLKHFPGYGSNADTHTGSALDTRPLDQFRTADFLPFAAGIQSGGGTTAVLVSHNVMQSVDPERPASLSPKVHELLRKELGFSGVAMTDDLIMQAVVDYSKTQSTPPAVLAIRAGNDLLITQDYQQEIPQVIAAVKLGQLSIVQVRDACRRVLGWKQELGLLPPISPEN